MEQGYPLFSIKKCIILFLIFHTFYILIHIIRVDLYYIFEQFLLFKTSETQSTIMSACASSARFFPAKLNSLAKNLAMDIDCAIVVPSYSNTGSTPHGVSKVFSLNNQVLYNYFLCIKRFVGTH